MSSISPSCESPAFGSTYSDASSASGSTPSTPTHSRPFISMAITELVISEAHYLAAVNRIGNALSQAAEANPAAGHKESSTIRSVSDRWAELTRMQTKFHDDVVAVNEDLRDTAGLLNGLLVTLEPILIDHSRDLSISLKKLIRRDQKSEHTAAKWESALRQPLDHLSSYEEWLLRIDPQLKFCKDYHTHLQGLIYKSKMVADANQHPRNMLRRLSTMARDVIKRRSSVQLITQGGAISETTTPTTPHSASTFDSRYSEKSEASTCSPTTPNSILMTPDNTVMALGIANNNDLTIDTVTKPASTTTSETKSPLEKGLPKIPSDASFSQSQPSSPQEPATPIADTFLAPPQVKQLHHCPSSASELSSTTTLAIPSSSSLASSSTSVHSKNSSSSAETIIQVQIQEQVYLRSNTSNATLTRQKFLDDKEARKATLRVGTSDTIQARAQSLQSPSYNSRASAESLRKVSPTKPEAEKPPVKSLINFWEQVNDPLEV
ncbi:hypothetical protein BGX30_013674 [Mortierella sp. GBA39]|nr:hypothetical protein BGX30_013674 [Mortierella sp. GBA39]